MAKILVIDDTKNIRKMVRLTLAQVGHDVEEAEDGESGLEKFGDGSNWDLTLVDQRMPNREGIEVVREARRRDPAARLILITAFASEELALQVLEVGAIDFLRKPFATSTLRGAVDTALKLEKKAISPTEAAQIFSNQQIALPEPGQEGFSIPRLSFRINGFSFWPVAVPDATHPPGLELGRFFQIRDGDGNFSRTFVGVTGHVLEQLRRETGWKIEDSDAIWDQLCGQALLNFIWEKSECPPTTLPVYEIPLDLKNNRPARWTLETN